MACERKKATADGGLCEIAYDQLFAGAIQCKSQWAWHFDLDLGLAALIDAREVCILGLRVVIREVCILGSRVMIGDPRGLHSWFAGGDPRGLHSGFGGGDR